MEDWQFSFGGLTVGDGTDYPVSGVTGLEDFEARGYDEPAATRAVAVLKRGGY